MKYPHLFTPLQVGNALFRNRIFSSPTGHVDTSLDGEPTDRMIAYYARKALGGAASVAIGECCVDRARGRRGSRHIDLQSRTNTYMLSRLASAITSLGAVASTELQHGGYAANSIDRDGPAWSSVGMEYHGHPVEQMDEDLIWETIGLYADAAFQHLYFETVGDEEQSALHAERMEAARAASGDLAPLTSDIDSILAGISLPVGH